MLAGLSGLYILQNAALLLGESRCRRPTSRPAAHRRYGGTQIERHFLASLSSHSSAPSALCRRHYLSSQTSSMRQPL